MSKSAIQKRMKELNGNALNNNSDSVDEEIIKIAKKHKKLITALKKYFHYHDEIKIKNGTVQLTGHVGWDCENYDYIDGVLVIDMNYLEFSDTKLAKLLSSFDFSGPITFKELSKVGFESDNTFLKHQMSFGNLMATYKALPKHEREIVDYEVANS